MALGGVLAVVVRFTIDPAWLERFMDLMAENSRLSRELEPGCMRFDVLQPEGGAPVVVLYELYRSAENFADHLRRPHYLAFDAATKTMVIDKRVERLVLF